MKIGQTINFCLVLALSLGLGCGSEDSSKDNNDAQVTGGSDSTAVDGVVSMGDAQKDPNTQLTVSFKSLKPCDGLKEKASLEIETNGKPSKIELLVDGKVAATTTVAPYLIEWDTTQTQNGMVKLSLKAYQGNGSVTSDEVPALIYNGGEPVTFIDGDSGKVTVPASGYIDQHLKFHWDMPDNVKGIIAGLCWDKTGFELELAVGLGACPDHGTTVDRKAEPQSPVAIIIDQQTGTLKAAQWFAHVQLVNPTSKDVLGKEAAFQIRAFLMK